MRETRPLSGTGFALVLVVCGWGGLLIVGWGLSQAVSITPHARTGGADEEDHEGDLRPPRPARKASAAAT